LDKTLKSGTCPKCGSNEVYNDSKKMPNNQRAYINISATRAFTVVTYICINCGYFEEYIKDEDLRDEKNILKIKDKWSKGN
jgi:predicted nucleic-acid-binding Zn-ribbon protein